MVKYPICDSLNGIIPVVLKKELSKLTIHESISNWYIERYIFLFYIPLYKWMHFSVYKKLVFVTQLLVSFGNYSYKFFSLN